VTSEIFAKTTHAVLPHQSCHVGWGPGRSQSIKIGSGVLAP